jgi:thiamine biosynthesis lipoprotein
MGTRFDLYLYTSGPERFAELFEASYGEVKRVEKNLSTYDPTSELSRINGRAAQAPVHTDPEVFGLLREAVEFSRRTGGAFDPTVGPLVEAWGFYREQGHLPSDKELAEARAQTGWTKLRLDSTRRTVHFEGGSLKVDLGGSGKGYALDRVAALLRRQGVEAALIGLGTSTFYALGAPPDAEGWLIRVPSPVSDTATVAHVRLRNEALSTSGSGEQQFTLDGQTYSHLLDPRTGRPVQGRLQTTVVTPRATESDVLSTALFVLGPESAREYIGEENGREALFVEAGTDGERVVPVRWSGALTTTHSVATNLKE